MPSDLLDAQYPVLDWWALASALHRLASTISMMVVLIDRRPVWSRAANCASATSSPSPALPRC